MRVVWFAPSSAAEAAAFVRVGEMAGPFAGRDPVGGAVALGIAGEAGEPRARASLWLLDDLAGAPGRSGAIGHYEALEAGAGVALLAAARERLAAHGAVRVLGPMNGSTWRRYRLELPRAAGDPELTPDGFAGEPRNPPRYVADFLAAGFREVERYETRFEPALAIDAPRLADALARARAAGIAIRPLDPAAFDGALRAMHALSLRAFADNAFYAPLAWEAFAALYAPFRARLDPSLVRLAEDGDGRLVGYTFGFADPLAIGADGRPARTVFKTMAVDPDRRGAGLGSLLFDDFRAAAATTGTPGLLHALMRSDNRSLQSSTHRGAILFKRYALFGSAA